VTLKDAGLPSVGEKIPLRYVGSRLYAFDRKTGMNICQRKN
jgi:hypothetical protein